jgi:hypothetical protein
MSKQKKDKMDWCKNHPKRPREYLYKSIPYCEECFNRVVEEENKDKLAEFRKTVEEKKKNPPKPVEGVWW